MDSLLDSFHLVSGIQLSLRIRLLVYQLHNIGKFLIVSKLEKCGIFLKSITIYIFLWLINHLTLNSN